MKTLSLTPSTKLNAILIVDKSKKSKNVAVTSDMNMTLLEWTMHYSMSDTALKMPLPNLLSMKFSYEMDSSNDTHKMSAYKFEDKKYLVFVSVFDK